MLTSQLTFIIVVDPSCSNPRPHTRSTVAFNVTVTKGGSSLVFECESDGTYVTVGHLSHEPKDGHVSESSYTVCEIVWGLCESVYLLLLRWCFSEPGGENIVE